MTATVGAKRLVSLSPTQIAAANARTRKQHSDEKILGELIACAKRVGKSPTIEQFDDDKLCSVHPHTVIARFGSWNEAKRRAGLRAVRFATDEEVLAELAALGAKLGHAPSAHEVAASQPTPSVSSYINRFGSLARALQLAGFDVPASADEKLDRAIREAVAIAEQTGSVPSMTQWAAMRKGGAELTGEFAIYRLCANDAGISGWAAFTLLVEQEVCLLAQLPAEIAA
jgi:hypothetical protein